MNTSLLKIIIFSLIPGIFTGLILVYGILATKYFHVPAIAIKLFDIAFVIVSMISSTFMFKKKYPAEFNFKTSRNVSFYVYIIAISVLSIRRISDGYFSKFSLPAVLLALFVFGLVGWCVSYIIAINLKYPTTDQIK